MTSAPGHHAEHAERVSLYALQVLPASETAAVEAHLAGCPECRGDLASLRSVVEAFVAWPTDLLRPSASLRDRLARRIASDAGTDPVWPAPRPPDLEWKDVAPGIACRLLATDTATRRVSMLVRLAPGTEYPPHRHAGVEELFLLDGALTIDDRTLAPGDYNRGAPGGVDRRVWSATGCTCVLITSIDDALL